MTWQAPRQADDFEAMRSVAGIFVHSTEYILCTGQ